MPKRTAEPERERHEAKSGYLDAHLLFRAHRHFIERFRLALAVKIYIDRSLRLLLLRPEMRYREFARLYRND